MNLRRVLNFVNPFILKKFPWTQTVKKRFLSASNFKCFLILYSHTRTENDIAKSDNPFANYLLSLNDKKLASFGTWCFQGLIQKSAGMCQN